METMRANDAPAVADAAPTAPLAESDGRDAALLKEYLADRDTLCPRCGYNLRALQGGRCPECGDELRLQVALVQPRFGAFIAAIGGLFVGFGGSLMFLLLALKEAPASWWGEPEAMLLLAQLFLTSLFLALLLACRRRFRTLDRRAQRLIAVASWGLVLALSTAVIVYFG